MSGTRFARSGRGRLIVCVLVFVLVFGMIAIFHSSQQQLDEARQQHLHCEQQQEVVNERLKIMVEQKITIEKNREEERQEYMDTIHNLERKLKESNEKLSKQKMEAFVQYDKLDQSLKLLQSEHSALVTQCAQTNKQHLEDTNGFENKLKSLRSELQNEKKINDNEISVWKEKYDKILREKDRLELLLNTADSKSELQRQIVELQHRIDVYQTNCDLNGMHLVQPQNVATTRKTTSRQTHSINKPSNEKSFSQQEIVSPGLYHILVKTPNNQMAHVNSNATDSITNSLKRINMGHPVDGELSSKTDGNVNVVADSALRNLEKSQHSIPFPERLNHSSIINSVENLQILPKLIDNNADEHKPTERDAGGQAGVSPADKLTASPLSAPRKITPTESSKSDHRLLEPNDHKNNGNFSMAASSKSLQPLLQPANQRTQRKLPINVAPIPGNFDELAVESAGDSDQKRGKVEDVKLAIDATLKVANIDANNNRYSNAISDLKEQKVENIGAAAIADKDTGDPDKNGDDDGMHDFLNDQNFNIHAEEDNFFEGANGKSNAADDGKEKKKEKDDEDDGPMVAGGAGIDIALKSPNHLLENLNNEIAADQGKEFPPDGLQLDDGNEEDEDEDDYSNLMARQQGAQAIRN